MSLEQWQAVISVNLTGVFLCAREAALRMVKLAKRRGDRQYFPAFSRQRQLPARRNYSAAKSGRRLNDRRLGQGTRATWHSRRGRCAGFTRTEILTSMKPEILQKVIAPVPLGRLGDPNEIAHAPKFIIENDFFTGRCVGSGWRLAAFDVGHFFECDALKYGYSLRNVIT